MLRCKLYRTWGLGSFIIPNNFINKIIEIKNLVKHYFHIVTRVPVAVIVETSGFFENAIHLNDTRTHVSDICFRIAEPILKRSLFLRITPKNLIASIAIKRRVNVN